MAENAEDPMRNLSATAPLWLERFIAHTEAGYTLAIVPKPKALVANQEESIYTLRHQVDS